jgi:hypothetical protein
VINEPLMDYGFQRYQLTKANEIYKVQELKKIASEKECDSKEIDLDNALASDIVQIS